MSVHTIFISTAYSISQATLGLILHPYQTMQYLVEEKIFVWLVFIPSFLFALFLPIWWLSIKLFFFFLPYIGIWAFTLVWAICFAFFWQILLLYLLFRFWVTLR